MLLLKTYNFSRLVIDDQLPGRGPAGAVLTSSIKAKQFVKGLRKSSEQIEHCTKCTLLLPLLLSNFASFGLKFIAKRCIRLQPASARCQT